MLKIRYVASCLVSRQHVTTTHGVKIRIAERQVVQKTLAANRVDRGAGKGNHHLSLLAGLVRGELMTPSHAVKKGVRYRYYVSKSLVTEGVKAERTGQRIPAPHIEALVAARVYAWLADPVVVLNAVQWGELNAMSRRASWMRQGCLRTRGVSWMRSICV